MIPYTTTTLTFTVPANLTNANVIVSLRQNKASLDKKADSVAYEEGKSIVTMKLTQAETGEFSSNTVQPLKAQINWITNTGDRFATLPVNIEIPMDNLLSKVINYG